MKNFTNQVLNYGTNQTANPVSDQNTHQISDEELYRKVKCYGRNALLWRQKFIGLLPEVNRRRLYEKKNFSSIFEFAFKLGGLSEEHVKRVLNLEQRFNDKPLLKKLLVDGEVSMNKLLRVASIACSENEKFWAERVRILPNRAIETLVRDEALNKEEAKNGNGLSKPLFEEKSVHVHEDFDGNSLELNNKVLEKLHELKTKGFDVNELLLEFLKRREEEIAHEKEIIRETLTETHSRYIPIPVKRVIQKEYGTKCSIRTCHRLAEHLHHTQTFALSKRHDPHYLAPLCKEHHIIAHSINLKVQEKREQAVL